MKARDFVEYAIRRLYYPNRNLVQFYQRLKVTRSKRAAGTARWDAAEIEAVLRRALPEGRDFMLHSSLAGLGTGTPPHEVLRFFISYAEKNHSTLLIPTHPTLKRAADGVLEYRPRQSPSSTGLIAELARRAPGFKRSLHPFSSVAAYGAKAEWYLEENLNERRPLPHGKDSPYARLATEGGFAVCVGIRWDKTLAMTHVAEEVLDEDFPTKLVFEDVPVRVITDDGNRTVTIRHRSRRLLPNISMWTLKEDLEAAGAISSHVVQGIRLDIVDCRKVFQLMYEKGRETGYPYLFLGRKSRRMQKLDQTRPLAP